MNETAQTRILNVDDAEVALYTKTRILRHAGYSVTEALTGREALRRVENDQPSLVLLDVRLPDISGTEVCRIIKERWPSTMVLQTSATYVTAADRTRGLDGGADSYLTQPIDPAELVAEVRALMRLHAAEEYVRGLNDDLERRIAERTSELRVKNVRLVEQMAQRERIETALFATQRLEAVQQVGAVLRNDLRTPLSLASVLIESALAQPGDPAANAALKDALAALAGVARLAVRYLEGIPDTPAQAIDVAARLGEMQAWLEAASGVKVHIAAEAGGRRPMAQAHAEALESAILNLVLNARDAIGSDGIVTIDLRHRQRTESTDALTAGAYVVVTIADRGTGMSASVAAHAGEPFFSTRGKTEGVGLGLNQVRQFAQSVGGELLFKSDRQGTAAELWLRASEG
ncbi:MAG TPA: response regulator [Burkholderiaceae bacterium]|jgi:DNA-binding response OmpR family regulator